MYIVTGEPDDFMELDILPFDYLPEFIWDKKRKGYVDPKSDKIIWPGKYNTKEWRLDGDDEHIYSLTITQTGEWIWKSRDINTEYTYESVPVRPLTMAELEARGNIYVEELYPNAWG